MYRSARLIASFVRESLCAWWRFHPLQMKVQELKLAWRRSFTPGGVPSSSDQNAYSSERVTWVNTQKDKLRVRAFSLVLRLFQVVGPSWLRHYVGLVLAP